MNDDIHLPWDRQSLQALLLRIISTGEMDKADLKKSFDLSDSPHQAELLKDLSAIANTYSHHYRNHGFLIFGAEGSSVVGCTFPNTEDHLQTSVDDLVKRFLGPFVTTHLFLFSAEGKHWGAIVIPPSRNVPHVFMNDIHKRYRGDVYVRSGTTIVKAQPEDYARFFRQHLEAHTYEFQQTVNDLQRQVSTLTERLNSLYSAAGHGQQFRPIAEGAQDSAQKISDQELHIPDKTVSERIRDKLAREEDVVAKGLFEEVRKINAFLDSNEIPWAAQVTDKQTTEEILRKIETVSSEFWRAVIELMMKDEKGIYHDALIRAFSYLARMVEPPTGVTYNQLGQGLRYYPVFVTLLLICIIGTTKKRNILLKSILKLNLRARSHYDFSLPITYVPHLIRRAQDFFQTSYEGYPQTRSCDSVGMYTKSMLDRFLTPDDPLWDKDTEFYRGEYLLSLSAMDSVDPLIEQPSLGVYLFASHARPIITQFLEDNRDWLTKVFNRPLDQILSAFDQTAESVVRGAGCIATGFTSGALKAAFPEKVKNDSR
jgi:hypothetical protein